jgi:nucleotide-binding universal stress UspA family protein
VPDPRAAETIVVPLDGSELAERALPIAARLARPVHGRLVLLACATDHRAAALRTYLSDLASDVTDVPVDTAVIAEHEVADTIVEFAEAHDAWICMTSHGRGGLRWAVLGSVAERVVAGARQPVLLVGPHCLPDWVPGPGPVLVAHDGSHLGNVLLDAACDWARRLETTLLLTTVIHPLDAEDAERPAALFADPEERIRSRGCTVDHLVVQRHFPAGVLADLAVDRKAPLVVMGSHGRRGLERFLLGSTTMALLDLVPCPVVVTAVGADEIVRR